jgi:malate dehydrogenase (oxaloacetate-decarboxylating)
MDFGEESLRVHAEKKGKIELVSKMPVKNRQDLSIAYTPGVAAVASALGKDSAKAFQMSIKANTVAVLSDGSAVLGLGNIGPYGALPVMEGKAVLLKEFGGVDAFPICVDTQEADQIIDFARKLAPAFGGINLEDIAAPKCFKVESELQDLGIPVFHDDQHGTAIVVLAALINSTKVAGRKISDLKIVISGAGAAGVAIAKLLHSYENPRELIMCDSKGVISAERDDLNPSKRELLEFTNQDGISGSLKDALLEADVFIGVSGPSILKSDDILRMNENPIVFAMANPIPEIMPEEAKKGGAYIIGTGRSDYPNQINNVLAFPGIFRGALDIRAPRITEEMKLAAAQAIADCVDEPSVDKILPLPFEREVHQVVAKAVSRK